ncbi:MAG: VWA domain-containing protein, partial [Thermoanaerobaculia bacterium]
MSKTPSAAVATGVAVLFAAAASAQPPPLPGFAATTEVRVVNVEVRAFDDHGRPVTDLRREEFRIYENGREVPISHFFSSAAPREAEPVAAPSPPTAPEAAAAPATPLHVAILVDNVHLGAAHRATAHRYVANFAETSLPPEAQVMLASYDGGLNVRLGFGEPRARLSAALTGMSWVMAMGMQSERGLRDALEMIRWRQQAAIESPEGPCPRALLDLARAYAEPKQEEVEHAIAALALLVDALAGLPGRKVVLLVSDGFPVRAGAEVFGYVGLLCDGSGAR